MVNFKTTKMIEQVKQLRVEIDGLAQLCEGLKPIKDAAAIHKHLSHLCTVQIFASEEERLDRQRKYREEYEKVDYETSRNTEEIKEAIKSLKLSKAWLGKVLESLGSENPYGSGYKTVEDIVPTADEHRGILHDPKEDEKPWLTKSHTEKVDWLRTEIKRLLDKLERPTMPIDVSSIKEDFDVDKYLDNINKHGMVFIEPHIQEKHSSMNKAIQYLQEARFWLGFEMGRIRDESK